MSCFFYLKNKMRFYYEKYISHYVDLFFNKYYPLTVINKLRSKSKNKNYNFSLITGNCIGGYIYHQLGLPFSSPTINLMIYNHHLLKLVSNLDYYMGLSFDPIVDPSFPDVPCAKLDDIIVHFTHYKNIEDGIKCWDKRKKRINKDNLYIITSDMMLTEEQIKAYADVPCKKLVIFTSKPYDYPYCFYVKRYAGLPCVASYIGKTISGKWKFEHFFDYVAWLNSDDPVAMHFSKE